MSTKHRIKLIVSYDGTDFCGWAPQTGQRTVHGTLTEAVRQVSGDDCEITGASRTDSGAHALGQVCHFDTLNPMPPERWVRVLNNLLPSDLSVRESSVVADDFHSRFSADRRWYRYRIGLGVRKPLASRFVHHWGSKPLQVELMANAAQKLVGPHDFYAFSQLTPPEQNTRRELFSVEVTQAREEVRIDVVGTAFLRGMMRRISGMLLEIGRGARELESIPRLLRQREVDEKPWPAVLPANGLCLMKVIYGRHPKDSRTKRRFEREEEDDE